MRTMPKCETFVMGKLDFVSFTLFLYAFPYLDPKGPLLMLCMYAVTFLSLKSILGQGGRASKTILKDINFNFLMANVTYLSILHYTFGF